MDNLFNKMKFFLLLIFFLCTAQKNVNLGSTMNQNLSHTSKVLIPSGALIDAANYVHNNNVFTIGISQENTVIYISTVDPNFEIKGLRINHEILKIFKSSKVSYITGWGYYIQVNSDWYAGFDINSKPNEHSKIQWFFKYKFSEGNKNLFKE